MKIKSFKYRIYPTQDQQILIAKHFWVSRFVWNYYLRQRQDYYLTNKEEIEAKRIKWWLNYYDNAKDLTQLKKQNERITEVNSQTLQATLKHLDWAYKMFFRKTHQFPKYKSKKKDKSFTIPQYVTIKDWKLSIPKFKEWIKIKLHRPLEWDIINATISMNCVWYYFVSISCNVDIKELPFVDKQVWIDLWIKDFAICSDWITFENNKYLKRKQSKLKYIQRKYSKYKWNNTLKKLQKLHIKVSNQRQDFLHKVSTKIVKDNQLICLEDLNVKWIMSNHKLAWAVSDVAWSSFVSMLEYKADWYWRTIVKIDRFFPSSKMCNNCWWINQELTLKDRERECKWCWTTINRDLNASKNILQQWLNKYYGWWNSSQKQDELSSIEEAMTLEATRSLA
jgi:putative transposase